MRALRIVALLALGPAVVRAGGPVYGRLALVPAYCGTTTFAPCAPAFAFRGGSVTLTGSREPRPTCPRTGMPQESPAGAVKLAGVTKGGAPFSGTLRTETVLKSTFGSDPSGDCALRELQFTTPSLVGDVACRAGRCRGILVPLACLPANCADTPITTEFVSFKVLDDGQRPDAAVAVPGTVLAPLR